MASSLLSPRHLPLRALRRAAGVEAPRSELDDAIPLASPGEMQLFSYFVPGLFEGAKYTISARQEVSLGAGTKIPAETDQEFYTTSSPFALPADAVHSVYPSQGHTVQPNIAPHVVFKDCTLPWCRDVDPGADPIPWLAVFPFDVTEGELAVTADELATIKSAVQFPAVTEQNANMSVPMTIKSYLKMKTIGSLSSLVKVPDFTGNPDYSALKDDETPVDVVFIRGSLYKKLMYPRGGNKTQISDLGLCAHVRSINTEGVTGTDASDTGIFGVVHSKRSGPIDIAAENPPRSQAVHLISLEHLRDMTVANNQLVALVSLHSWTYLCESPDSLTVADALIKLGVQVKYSQVGEDGLDASDQAQLDEHILDTPSQCYLKYPPSAVARVRGAELPPGTLPDPLLAQRRAMADRMDDGHVLVRYRVQSGEETAALFRGVLLPVSPKAAPGHWPTTSNNGQDLQIFDRELSLMNITYSSAWQLGRMMATSDVAFVSALGRIRSRVYQAGLNASDLVKAHEDDQYMGKAFLFATLSESLGAMSNISTGVRSIPTIDQRSRWARPSRGRRSSPGVNRDAFSAGVREAIRALGAAAGSDGDEVISDIFGAASEDWRTMHDWLLDRMFLDGIPSEYLIADRSFLPPESVRFFHIDGNWMDCFIDGALSCHNHSGLTDKDVTRDKIKEQFNLYLTKPVATAPSGSGKAGAARTLSPPQRPNFGLFIRSSFVAAFKQLIVEAPFVSGADSEGRAPILAQKRLGPDILMVLLDRLPDSGELASIRFTQPPHQQSFAIASDLNETSARYTFRKLPYGQVDNTFLDPFSNVVTVTPSTAGGIYDFTSRCIDLTALANTLLPDRGSNNQFTAYFKSEWSASQRSAGLNSAFVGIQLNTTLKYLEFLPPGAAQARARAARSQTASAQYLIRTAPPNAGEEDMRTLLAEIRAGTGPEARSRARQARASIATPAATAIAAQRTLVQRITRTPASPLARSARSLAQRPLDRTSFDPTNDKLVTEMSYEYRLFPQEMPFGGPAALRPGRGWVWTDIPRLGHVIVAVHRKAELAPPKAQLFEVQLIMPLGAAAPRRLGPSGGPEAAREVGIEGPGLIPDSTAPSRVRMLSNDRWMVELSRAGSHLTVHLLPRSVSRRESVASNQNLSFVMQGLDIGWQAAPRANESGVARCRVVEIYGLKERGDQGIVSHWLDVEKLSAWHKWRGG